MAVALTADPVTAYSFLQIAAALDAVGDAEKQFLIAPSIGQSLTRDLNKSGIVFLETKQIGDAIAQW